MVLLGVTLGAVLSDWLQRVDLLIYDSQQRLWSRPAPADIVIVAIDEYSLSKFGRWPWPRRTHAQLLDKLGEAGVRAVVMDIIFAEPDRHDPDGDALLARAMERQGKVILPVLLEQRYVGGQLIETLPLPPLTAAARALGHAHVELDADGISRSVYLKEGLSDAYWPHLSIALLTLLGEAPSPLPGDVHEAPAQAGPDKLLRNNHVLTPYAGPPGHFRHVAYARLFEEPELLNSLRDKIIFVGATATGLGDLLPTPVSALGHPMAGVEINANIFDAIRSGIIIEPTTLRTRLLISALIALLPALLFPRLSPRNALFMSAGLFIGTLALSILLLTRFHLWFPPAAPLLALIIAYPLWSWRRLEYANRFLSQELARLSKEPDLLPRDNSDDEAAMAFIKRLMPIEAWTLYQAPARYVAHWGRRLERPRPGRVPVGESWRHFGSGDREWWLGIAMGGNGRVSDYQRGLILDLVKRHIEAATPAPTSAIELFEERVLQVQQAENRLRAMRRFLDDSLNQMADGILVISNQGQLSFINAKGLSYLNLDGEPAPPRGRPILPLLDAIAIEGGKEWLTLLASPLLRGEAAQANGRTSSGLDLLIQINPLSLEEGHIDGVIINLSDITRLRAEERQRLETFSFLSHDLRAPLASLLALLEMGRDGKAIDDDFLQRIEMYALRTLNLAEDFLQVSQLEHMEDLQLQSVDLTLIVANAIDAAWDHSSAKQIRLIEALPDEPVYVRGNPGLLERAVLNLINNAIKYSPEETRVEIAIEIAGASAICRIRDSGFGIPPEALDKIFDRYFRIDDQNQTPGSGLGLSFVKSVVEKHRGAVTVASIEGKGSTFCIRLPLESDPDQTPDQNR